MTQRMTTRPTPKPSGLVIFMILLNNNQNKFMPPTKNNILRHCKKKIDFCKKKLKICRMSKKTKGKVIGVRICEEQQKQLQRLSNKTEVSQSTLIRVALRRFFREMEKSEHPVEDLVT